MVQGVSFKIHDLYAFVHQKSFIPKINAYFSNTQFPFRILYLPTQIQMGLCAEKRVSKAGNKHFYCTNMNNHQIHSNLLKY